MTAFTEQINTILEALGDDATPDQIANATRNYEARDVLAVVYARTDAAGGGGAEFPAEWTVGEDGSLIIEADGDPASGTVTVKLGAEQTTPPQQWTNANDEQLASVDATGLFSAKALNIEGGGLEVSEDATVDLAGYVEIVGADGSIAFSNPTMGFFCKEPVSQPTGVAVTDEAIHAALVTLGLITGP